MKKIAPHLETLSVFLLLNNATNTVIVIGLMQPELVTTIYHTRGEHPNHYTTDVVL